MYTIKTVTSGRVRRRVRMVCAYCGSENVIVYAEAYWDKSSQQWLFGDFQDMDDWCNDCGKETTVEERAIECASITDSNEN